jgi:hypothetical protein
LRRTGYMNVSRFDLFLFLNGADPVFQLDIQVPDPEIAVLGDERTDTGLSHTSQ